MNHAAILALIADLYQQIVALTDENKALREAAAKPLDRSPAAST